MSADHAHHRPSGTRTTGRHRLDLARTVVGGFYLSMGGVHLGIVAADPQFYGPFAHGALLPFVRNGWTDLFMAAPVFWGLCMVAGETALGVLLLAGGRAAKLGWAAVIAFHLLLMLFGWGLWIWCLPALAVLVPLAVRDWPHLTSAARRDPRARLPRPQRLQADPAGRDLRPIIDR